MPGGGRGVDEHPASQATGGRGRGCQVPLVTIPMFAKATKKDCQKGTEEELSETRCRFGTSRSFLPLLGTVPDLTCPLRGLCQQHTILPVTWDINPQSEAPTSTVLSFTDAQMLQAGTLSCLPVGRGWAGADPDNKQT